MTFTSSPLSWSHAMFWPWFSLHNNLYSLVSTRPTNTLAFSSFSVIILFSLSLSLTPGIRLAAFLSQGYEDWLRHKADCSINECPVDVVQQGKVVRTQSHKLRVRMASLEQHSTWGHKATRLYCCVAHFRYICRSHLPHLSSPLQSSPTLCPALSRSLLSFPPNE